MSLHSSPVTAGGLSFVVLALLVPAVPVLGQAAGRALFVANNGNLEGSITSFAINADGTLTFVGEYPANTNPYSIALSPDGRLLAVGRASGDEDFEEFRIFRVHEDATLEEAFLGLVHDSPLDVLWLSNDVFAVTETQLGGSFVHTYRYDEVANTIDELDVEDTGSFNAYLAFHPARPYLYTQDSTFNVIERFLIHEDGTLEWMEATGTPAYPLHLNITHDGSKLYAGGGISFGGDKIIGYALAEDGSLTELPGSPFISPGESPAYSAISSDDAFLFMGHGTDATVRSFAIGEDGALTSLGYSFDVGLQGSIGSLVVLDEFLFVTDDWTAIDGIAGVYSFAVQPDGSFVQIGDIADTQGSTPESMVAWRPPFCPADADCNGLIDLVDYAALADCLDGPAVAVPDSCSFADSDGDTDVDLNDVAAFQLLFDPA